MSMRIVECIFMIFHRNLRKLLLLCSVSSHVSSCNRRIQPRERSTTSPFKDIVGAKRKVSCRCNGVKLAYFLDTHDKHAIVQSSPNVYPGLSYCGTPARTGRLYRGGRNIGYSKS